MSTDLSPRRQSDLERVNLEDRPKDRRFRLDVQGLRALAVSVVVLYHAGVPGLSGGYVGVDAFFVLSGFLITGLVMNEILDTGRLSVARFYARRARRILPASCAVLVATAIASYFMLDFLTATADARDARWAAVFLANIHFSALGTNYLSASTPPSPVQHYWSLAIEEQFYFIWPPIVVACALAARRWMRDRSPRMLIGIVLLVLTATSLAWSAYQTQTSATAAYFSPLTRTWELGFGALLAVGSPLVRRIPGLLGPWLTAAGLAGLATAVVAFDANTPFPGTAALLPVVGTALIVAGGTIRAGSLIERALSIAPLVWLGNLSYSLYLVHWPVLTLAKEHAGHALSLGDNLLLVLLSLALAAGLHYWLENPVRRLPSLTVSTGRSLSVGLAGMLAAAAVGTSVVTHIQDVHSISPVAVSFSTGTPLVGPATITKDVETAAVAGPVGAIVEASLAAAPDDRSPAYSNGCLVASAGVRSPATCIYGEATAKRTVVLFGDSHAAQWLPALDAAAHRDHFKVVVLTKSNCPLPQVTPYNGVLKRAFTECVQWRSWALGRIRDLRPSAVIASSTSESVSLVTSSGRVFYQDPTFEALWDSGLTKTLRDLRKSSPSVVLVGDVPKHSGLVPECLAAHLGARQACSVPLASAYVAGHAEGEISASHATKTRYVSAEPWLCTRTSCPSAIAGLVVDWDDSHLTASYSLFLSHAVALATGLGS